MHDQQKRQRGRTDAKAPKMSSVATYLQAREDEAQLTLPKGGKREVSLVVGDVKHWSELWEMYRLWAHSRGEPEEHIAGYKTFVAVRKAHFKLLHCDASTDLQRCIVCTKLAHLLRPRQRGEDEPVTPSVEQCRQWVEMQHRNLARGEWLSFKRLERLATGASSPFLFIAIDGSPGLSVPSWSRATSDTATLPYSLIGAKIYGPAGVANRIYVKLTPLWPSSAKSGDFWMSVLLAEIDAYLNQCSHHRPRVLILHLDNTVRCL